MLISTIMLNFNRSIGYIASSLDISRYRVEELSMLTSHIEQVSQYFFDETSTDTVTEKRIDDFTLPYNLGFEANDSSIFDDIDDLHGVTVVDTGLSGVVYHIDYSVDYVELQNKVFVHSDTREYHKRIAIAISDTFDPPLITKMQNGVDVRDTLEIEVVISYWFYN